MRKEETVIFACKTISDEVKLAIKKTACSWPVCWLEDNLHNFPDKLRVGMQKALDSLDGCERVLMAFGFCGNAIVGLKTRSFSLVIPRIDDCISLLLGGMERRKELASEQQSIYLTEGWMRSEANIWSEYEYTLKKYGEENAKFIVDAMYGQYDALTVLDTGAYDVPSLEKKGREIAKTFSLEQKTVQGTTSLLERLLLGPWDEERFVVIPPYSEVTEKAADLKLL